MVGLGVYVLDYQLARSGQDTRPRHVIRPDGRRAPAIDIDSKSIREPGARLRAGLCRDAGRTNCFLSCDAPEIRRRPSPQLYPNSRVALCQRGILDRGRISRRTGADCFVAGRAWYRIYRSRCTILDATIGSDANNGLAGRRRSYGRTCGAVHHHRAWRIHCRHRRDVFRGRMDSDKRRRISYRAAWEHCDVVDLFSYRCRGRLGKYLSRQGSRPPGAAGLHLSASSNRRGHYRFGRGR